MKENPCIDICIRESSDYRWIVVDGGIEIHVPNWVADLKPTTKEQVYNLIMDQVERDKRRSAYVT